ncbi:MAG: phosphoribosylanthranilate isomerase [Alphaproteobacteria bacterium]
MSLLVKICGLTSPEGMDAALTAGADLVGIVHFAPSPRHLALPAAAALAERARGRAGTVLVTVNMAEDELAAAAATVQPDWIQFHGTESPAAVARMVGRTGCRAIKAIGVASVDDLIGAASYTAMCDMVLLDTKPPKGADRPGGHGIAFDWRLATSHKLTRPYLLSGGLTPDNVAAAVAMIDPPGVDVSSGVESAPGVKDRQLIQRFIAAARNPVAPAVKESMAQ